MCLSGYEGAPERACEADGRWATSVTGTCVRIKCSAESMYQNATWPATNAGTSGAGTCVTGYSGSPSRACSVSGVWAAVVSPACVRNTCPSDTFDNAVWAGNTPSMTTVVGTCAAGYAGTPSRACNADSTWAATTTNPCVRLFCPATLLNDATWPHTASGTANVTGECVAGYSGTPSRGCDLNGNWQTATAHCTRIRCSAVTEGFADWAAADSLTSVTATCQVGYQGSPSRTCGADGIYGEIINPCRRIVCVAHSHDNAMWPETGSGATASGTCDLGWAGSPTRDCSNDGLWSTVSSPCGRITCAAVNDTSAKAMFPAANAGATSVEGTCYDNTSGFPARDCFFNGTWSEVRNPCSSNPCPALQNNGHADWESPLASDMLVNGTCVAGYDTSLPPPQRMCKADGHWATEITNPCQPIYCTKTSPSYVSFNADWPDSVQAGSSASGTCVAGYSGTTARACSLAGEWGAASPACEPILCAAIGNDGAQSSWPQTQAGQGASGTCLAGYEGSPTRQCSLSGQWEAVSAPCTQKKCPAGTVSNSVWEATLGGLTATGACVIGTTGTVTRSCSSDGEWGPVSGSCVGIVCPAELAGNADWTTSLPGKLAYGECLAGFIPDPLPSRTCLENGSWGAVSGACIRLVCPGGAFENAMWPEETPGTEGVIGTCMAGWQGAPLRDCLESGLYSAVSNPCVRVTCAALDGETGTWASTNGGTDGVQGSCPIGTDGAPVRDCALNGTWSAVLSGDCVGRSCAAEPSGHVDWPATAAGVSVGGTCPAGYAGSPSRACSSTGAWGAIVNPCVQNVCPAVFDDHVAWPTTPSLSLPVDGECETGYFGEPSRLCGDDGNWGPITNACAALLCPAALDGHANWFATSAGAETVGQCIAGYQGTPRRQCLLSGAWNVTITDPCTVKYDDCQGDAVGMTFFPPTSPGSAAEGNCATGYEFAPEGPPTRYCYDNGTWETTFSRPCVFSAPIFLMFFALTFACSARCRRPADRPALDEQDIKLGFARVDGRERDGKHDFPRRSGDADWVICRRQRRRCA